MEILLIVVGFLLGWVFRSYLSYRKCRKAGMSRGDSVTIALAGGPQPPP